jgi:phosphoribosyl 1,2-cyclic phosphate phosphodiesterase
VMYHSGFVRVTFLGTGTSHGVPMVGCDCAVCTSPDPRDNRLRSSIYVEGDDGFCFLVDTTTDLRMQALREGIRRIDAVLYTHSHADHILGLDELRRFNMITRQPIPVYGMRATLDDLRRTFAYAFAPDAPRGGGVPDLRLHPLEGPCCFGKTTVVPVPVAHGPWDVLGFRFGSFAYLTDCNRIPPSSLDLLGDLDVLVLDALRHKPHPTHFSLAEAIEAARRIGARRTYFTHIAHELGHEETCASLDEGMTLACDGLVIEVPSRAPVGDRVQ